MKSNLSLRLFLALRQPGKIRHHMELCVLGGGKNNGVKREQVSPLPSHSGSIPIYINIHMKLANNM